MTAPDVQVESPFSEDSSSSEGSSSSSPPRNGAPPQLPPRQNTHPPPLPRRRPNDALPPPPTRTIALGDKLPPPRRPQTPSSSEEEEEEKVDPAGMPDTSRASRRPPGVGISTDRIPAPSHSEVAVHGRVAVVAHHHKIRVWDVGGAEAPKWEVDLKDVLKDYKVKEKEVKVSSMEFLGAGGLLWLGTKEGHLVEVDVKQGLVAGVKLSAHTHAVTYIFRIARTMVTMDDNGKVLVFAPDEGSGEVRLLQTQPRVVRIADKQQFARVIGGKLWTSARMDPGTTAGGASSRGPIVRVYDILTPGSSGRSLLPTEHVGNVTCGTVLPSEPDLAYLGHEGGLISIWSLVGEGDGMPKCLEVTKISTSDVLCLEGVNDRLWAGGRKGMVAAYDVSAKPWVMTNNWNAHSGLPVVKLVVDPWSIEKLGRLCVISVGRDERVRFWDGLLAENWIDMELLKREEEFSNFRDLSVLVVSWNVDAAKPDALLSGTPENVNFLKNVLQTIDSPDIIVFGFQELIDLESRKMAAKSVLLGGKKKTADGTISEKVSSAYKKWYDKLVLAVRLAMPPETPYTVIHTENLVGLFSCIFVKNTERFSLKDVAITTIKRGMGGRYGNKGGIVARFIIDDTSICFINCHLAAGQHHVRQRNADVAALLEEKALFPASDTAHQDPVAYVGGGDGSMVLDHEIVFFNGDMNYRIDQRRDPVVAAVRAGDYDYLMAHDQLLIQMKTNRAFRLRTFHEGPLTFAPTYKYDRRSDEYDTSEKRRIPAWCDRILWRSRHPQRVAQLHYQRYEADVSDHRPISAGFQMTVKSVNREKRARVKEEVREQWELQEQNLLIAAREFYVSQAMLC
ncbi:DNase I-like protein [Heliocybe sulcata]|uniref:DNase I-like protein n=1 Tax=Heliocybe sulcata TaxID=5364 RepID=A0A5C3N935_9AGAM|nr:DNase I-like protein [Heliocybe sulcata]